MIRGSIPLLIYILITMFLYFRISRGLELKNGGKLFIGGALTFSLIIFIVYAKLCAKVTLTPLFLLSGFLMGMMLISSTFFFFELIFTTAIKKKKLFVLIALFLSISVSIYSWINGRSIPVVRNIEIKLKDIPETLSGFTIAHLSDIHIEKGITSERWLRKVVETTNKLKPDLIVITGDLVSMVVRDGKKYSVILSGFKAKFGVYCVTGNTDFGNNVNTFGEIINNTEIRVLINESVKLKNGIVIVGVDDKEGKNSRKEDRGTDLKKAFSGVDKSNTIIFLSHRPDIFDNAVRSGVDLQLSGHTHAGQIPPLDIFSKFYFKYDYGLYKKGDSYIYTSCGTGTWPFMPMRLFSKNEIIKIVLVN